MMKWGKSLFGIRTISPVNNRALIFIFFFFILEVLGHILIHLPTVDIRSTGIITLNKFEIASLVHIMGGLGIVFIFFTYHLGVTNTKSLPLKTDQRLLDPVFPVLLIILLGLVIQYYVEIRINQIPIDYRLADMLPVLDRMSERFLNGENVYDTIPEIWEGMQPIYLPAFWLPYIVHHVFPMDMRWISVLFLSGGLICTIMIIGYRKMSLNQLVLWTGSVLIFLIPILWVPSFLISHSQEGIAVGYYILLGYSLLTERWRLTGIAIGLCLMSRYTLVIWSMIFLIVLFITMRKRPFSQVMTSVIVTVSLLFLGTGSFGYIDVFLALPDQYLDSVMNNPSKYIPTINQSLGLAKFSSFEQLPLLHRLFQLTAILIPIAGFSIYRLVREKIPLELFAVGLLKLCLVFFYNFLVLPYPYLFYVSTAFSLILLVSVLRDPTDPIHQETMSGLK